MEKLLTYALKDGVLVDILSVSNGLSCGCTCPSCGESLIAVANTRFKEYKTMHHFRHVSGAECPGAYESALHLLAKEVLLDIKKLQLPDFHFDYDRENEHTKFEVFDIFEFEDVKIEVRVQIDDDYIVADVIGEKGVGKLVIEFANTHFVDFKKKEKIQNGKISCIEIDLRGQQLDKEQLKSFFLSKSNDIYWISNPVQEKAWIKQRETLDRKSKVKVEEDLSELRKRKMNIIRIYNLKLWICPKKVSFYKYFKTTIYYGHPIIKDIVDGEYWNEKFYGSYSTEEYIYFKEEKVLTSTYPNLGVHFDYQMRLLRNGLKRISERKIRDSKLCNNCEYNKGFLKLGDGEYQLCSFKTDPKYIKDI